MSVTKLQPREAFAKYGQPARHRLVELHGRRSAIAAEIAALEAPSEAYHQAQADLPAALEAHRQALQELDLGDGDAAAVSAARERVKGLRRTVADTGDHSAEIAALSAESRQVADAIKAETRAVIVSRVAELTADYQRHAKAALAIEAALQGIANYGEGDDDLATTAHRATQPARDLAESAQRQEKINAVLGELRRVWLTWPTVLASDPAAEPEHPTAAVALMPQRPEELDGGAHDAA